MMKGSERLTGPQGLRRENEALRDRISRLSAAVLRISASLDLDTVLHEIVESARAVTGARYGCITTIDDKGGVRDFVTSGITAEEHRRLAAWSDGRQLFEHLRDLPGPLTLGKTRDYVRSLGFSTDLLPSGTLQATPMRHRGAHIGNFFLADKARGREFTDEDEETLVLFASQAAAAIANARTHRRERRARADLEALVDTCPVGVAVFDARTGQPVSLNREARRIVGRLHGPGDTPEGLLGVITCRRADGREVSLEEFPLAQQLSNADTVRAEEIELSTPDGRRVRALVNATPIRGGDGGVESVVVTLQDLADLDELERLRTEFLAMVSHELRAPLTSIVGSTTTLLRASRRLDPAEMREYFRIIDEQAHHMRGLIDDLLDAGRIETGTLSVAPEAADVAGLVEQARKTFLSGEAGARHPVRIDLPPDLPRVMADGQRVVQVLNNLLANAARHSPESSPIRVSAAPDGVHVAVSVSNEGPGVPPEQLPHLFRKHARAAVRGGEGAGPGGHGLGLAICKGLVEAHGGRIRAESAGTDRGIRFTFTLPAAEEAGRRPEAGAAPGGVPPVPGAADRRRDRRILVVDDDPQTLRGVRDALDGTGYVPVVTGDPRELPELLRTRKPRLVLLDLMLPGGDGIKLMERIPGLADLPVIFLSGYGGNETIARALEAGAADYIVKPFAPTELTARVRAALRRSARSDTFVLGDLTIDYDRRRVTLAGRAVPLTPTEYELVRVLSIRAGRATTYDTLLREAWRDRNPGDDARLVRAVVKQVRRKLDDDAKRPAYIFTEHGVGYRMAEPGGER